ncbi:hypothetical protein OKW24_000677 [Peribacillus simplex]|nr:hypothetical protein [Peribacillus simplex]SNS78573.1 hypothetical protein SAMN05444672_102289 [Bacillus sp. OK838]
MRRHRSLRSGAFFALDQASVWKHEGSVGETKDKATFSAS